MLVKFSILALVLSFLIFYLKINESFYHVCNYSTKEAEFFDNYLNEYSSLNNDTHKKDKVKENIDKLKNLCSDFQVDYSTHPLMKLTLGSLDEIIYKNEKNFTNSDNKNYYDEDYMKTYIENLNPENLKLSLLSIKLAHIVLYAIILYSVVISFPNIAVEIIIYFFNKILGLVFIGLLIEAVLKFYFPEYLEILSHHSKIFYSSYLDNLLINMIGNPVKILIDILNIRNYF